MDERIRKALQGMRTKLGFTTTILARMDPDRGGLVLSFSMGQRKHLFKIATKLLGFDLSGAVMPLWAEDSLFVRCYRQGRIVTTNDLSAIAGSALPHRALRDLPAIGKRLYVCVPVPGSSGAIEAVVFLDRGGADPLSSEDREHLIIYADRLGRLLEADRLGAQVTDESPMARWLSVHLLDRDLHPLWSGGSGPRAEEVVTALGSRFKPGPHEITLKNGSVIIVHVNFVDPRGKVSWLLLCEDVAGRDRETRELRELLRLKLASVSEAVISVDAELKITAANEPARELSGFEPAEMIGTPLSDYLPDKNWRDLHRELAASLLKQGHVTKQLNLRRKDGTTFPAELSALLLADEGQKPAGAIATVRDLSEQRRHAAERHRLERQLIRSERLAALGEMAARIAHEVRNPLAAIGATAMTIEEDPDGGDQARESAKAISSEVRRLDRILTDLLQFAKPTRAAKVQVNILAVLEEAVALCRADPKAQGVAFKVAKPKNGVGPVTGSADGFRQVFLNLLRNGAEACGAHGAVSCRITEKAGVVTISIKDTGDGIPANIRTKIFEPFFSTKSRGTGLGLPISRRIIEENGGQLGLGSARGSGTTLKIELPSSNT